jgi:hypothetical protein
VVIPTSYGYIPASKQPEGAETQASYYFGDHGPTLWRANMEVVNPLKESMVEDWSAIGKLMKVVFDREMRLGLPGKSTHYHPPAATSIKSKFASGRFLQLTCFFHRHRC